jgi:hypothetical protein
MGHVRTNVRERAIEIRSVARPSIDVARPSTEVARRVRGGLVVGALLAVLSTPAAAQGIRGQVDWMILKRDSDSAGQAYLTGPDAFGGTGIDFEYESGYRVMLGWGTPELEIEARYTRLDEWGDRQFATLSQELVFDANEANPFIVGGTPGNRIAFPNALFDAASDALTATLDDETLEGEFLAPGARLTYEYQSQFSDFELNVTTGRVEWFRIGLGYRHFAVDERSALSIVGLFDALDVDDGATVGDVGNDLNDGLSDAALVESGLTLIAGSADGYDNAASGGGPDTLTLRYGAKATNRLNGLQGTLDAVLLDSQYVLIDGFFRLGLFQNHAEATVVERVTGSGNDTSVYGRALQDSDNTFAFATSLGFRLAVKLTDNLRMHTGYDFVYIDGLALAPEQVRQIGPGGTFKIDHSGDALIHGTRLGLELIW